MKCDRNLNCDIRSNPCLFFGILLNLIFQLTRHLELGVLQSSWLFILLCFLQGLALGLMMIGLLLASPKRAEAIRNWKKKHLPFLVRS